MLISFNHEVKSNAHESQISNDSLHLRKMTGGGATNSLPLEMFYRLQLSEAFHLNLLMVSGTERASSLKSEWSIILRQ